MKIKNFGIEKYDFEGVDPVKIIRIGHPTLNKVAEPFKDPTSDQAKFVAKQLLATVNNFGPVGGLAAPQINILKRAFIFQVPPHRADDCDPLDITVVINPKIEPIGDEMQKSWEGCLSVPDMMLFVPRYKRIRYEYWDMNGDFHTGDAIGYHAKAMQHEYDHLNGVLHFDRVESSKDIGYMEEIRQYRF